MEHPLTHLIFTCTVLSLSILGTARAEGAPKADLAGDCASLWAAEGQTVFRERLVDSCKNARPALHQDLVALARRGDWQASFLWYFRDANPPERLTTLSAPLKSDCKRLVPQLADSYGDATRLRRMRTQVEQAKACFKDAPVESNYFLTIAARSTETVWILLDREPGPLELEDVLTQAPSERALFLAAVPAGQGAVVLVASRTDSTAWPLVFRVEPGETLEKSDRFLDAVNGRRQIDLAINVSAGQRVFVNGRAIDIDPKDHGQPQRRRALLNTGAGQNSIVVLGPSAESDRQPAGTAEGAKPSEARVALLRDVLPSASNVFTYELDARRDAQAVGILPIVPESCHQYGVDEGSIRDRVKSFLNAHGESVGELGLLAETARKYATMLTALTDLPGESARLSRQQGENAETFGRGAKDLLRRGFRSLLDLRVSCSTTPERESILAITAVRVYLDRIAEQEAEPPGPTTKPAADEAPLFRTSSFVVTEPIDLRDGLVQPVAQLWGLSAVRLADTRSRVRSHDDLWFWTELVEAPDRAKIQVQVRVSELPSDYGDCEDVNQENRLLRRSVRSFDGGAQAEAEYAGVDGRSFTYALGPWSRDYLVVASIVADPPKTEDQSSALQRERVSYRCVRVVEPEFALSADYYFKTVGQHTPAIAARPERSYDRFFLGQFGSRSGFGLGFGYWATRRQGVTPASWADTSRLAGIGLDGTVPYVYDAQALMLGFVVGHRFSYRVRSLPTWGRTFGLDLRFYFLPRFEWMDDSLVPAELADFSQRTGGTIAPRRSTSPSP